MDDSTNDLTEEFPVVDPPAGEMEVALDVSDVQEVKEGNKQRCWLYSSILSGLMATTRKIAGSDTYVTFLLFYP